MKKIMFTILVFAFLVSQGIAQNVQIDVHEKMDFAFDFDFDMHMDTEFDINVDFDIHPEIFSNVNFNTNFNQNFQSEKEDGDPSIKEDIEIIIDKDGYRNDSELVIKNINGDVNVVGYDGDEIIIKGTKELWKKRGELSDQEIEDFRIETRLFEGNLFIYMYSPDARIDFYNGRMDYNWRWNDNDRSRVNFHFDLEIQIPRKLFVQVSTVNNGHIVVEDMKNGVKATNVNGSVTVKDVIGYTTANTVNGDIEVWFAESPIEDTDFQTVNGTINIYSPKDLSAIVTFESLHGELYTDFEQVKLLPNRLNKERNGEGFRFRINKTSPVQIGDGDIEIGFKMVNGDVYIRERKS